MKKIEDKIFRIIDVNLNRSQEGLRVCEEVIRFIFDDIKLTKKAKRLRHSIVNTVKLLPINHKELLSFRDSNSDVGKSPSKWERKRINYKQIFTANIQRAKESLRVLEEFSKIINERVSERFKSIRYQVYTLESETADKFF